MKRRQLLKLGLAAAATQVFKPQSLAAQQRKEMLKFLCTPDGLPPLQSTPSPRVTPFRATLFVPPIKQPVPHLSPPPDPRAHQRYEEYPPKKFYEIHEQEFLWHYHPDPPYDKGSWSWGWDGSTPGPTYHARYGEPVLVRIFNDLPPLGFANVTFGLPSTTTHLHNAHTAAESDGFPTDFIDSGEFWDHHYANFPMGHDDKEKLTTLWYHDHRMDFTAANVYAGLDGFYCLFDDQDSNDENDKRPGAFRLPSGKYDIPLILQDVLFDQQGQVIFNRLNTNGMLGDQYTVNRIIQPRFEVERRKYRFRILNGGPSRFYRIGLNASANGDKVIPFIVITGDGNFLPEPLCTENIYLSVAQRVDVIVDFSGYQPGAQIFLQNWLEQTQGQGPSGRLLPRPDNMLRFDVVDKKPVDNSRIPDKLRDLPPVDYKEVSRRRLWQFDYRGGQWTINGRTASPDMCRIDAEIQEGTAEIWTIRNEGKNWSHPIHSHFTEFLLLEVNGEKIKLAEIQTSVQGEPRRTELVPLTALSARVQSVAGEFRCTGKPVLNFMGGNRRDVATLLPNDELVVFMRWKDFHGRYVMHCHNVVHEDHAMMIRWDIVPQGKPEKPISCRSCDEPG